MITMRLGMLLFFGTHSLAIVAPVYRNRKVAALGTGRWKLFYSIIS